MSPPPWVTVAAVDWLHVVLGLVVVQAGVEGVGGHLGRDLVIIIVYSHTHCRYSLNI
jgi:hypothetical protein